MVEQMAERLAGDPDAEPAAIGDVRQGLPARRMFLAEDQLAGPSVARQCATRRCKERSSRSG
jgi:hypothetical protein